MRIVVAVFLLLLTVGSSFFGKPPGERVYHTLVYDAGRKQTILLDGYHTANNPKYGEVWVLDEEWHTVPGAGPLIRFAGAAAYNTKARKLVLFGGLHAIAQEEPALMNDTWEWNGSSWKQMNVKGPDARGWSAMAYDEARDRMVLFGGNTNWGKTAFGDTWEWDGNKWTKIEVTGPEPRSDFAMVYDSRTKKVMLFGGQTLKDMGENQEEFGDTWTWDGKTWTRISTSGPRARILPRMSYDSDTGITYLYGGCSNPKLANDNGPLHTLDDMWSWDGKTWKQVKLSGPTPGKRFLHAMTYDSYRKKTILYGGGNGEAIYGDTWEWDGKEWKKRF
ncbi:MAG TPA: kelch repeat-containing protein [Cyclobacteriaceae bacterium]|nr:kelch repeat-containing protein [Cyclobacteriaceae bacterium]